MTQAQILAACKLACRVSSNSLDSEFIDLINAAYFDLEVSGVADTTGTPYNFETTDQLVLTAVKTYVKLHLGDLIETGVMYELLEKAYWNQVALLKMRNYSDSKYSPEEDES